jgi:hypothetical protein
LVRKRSLGRSAAWLGSIVWVSEACGAVLRRGLLRRGPCEASWLYNLAEVRPWARGVCIMLLSLVGTAGVSVPRASAAVPRRAAPAAIPFRWPDRWRQAVRVQVLSARRDSARAGRSSIAAMASRWRSCPDAGDPQAHPPLRPWISEMLCGEALPQRRRHTRCARPPCPRGVRPKRGGSSPRPGRRTAPRSAATPDRRKRALPPSAVVSTSRWGRAGRPVRCCVHRGSQCRSQSGRPDVQQAQPLEWTRSAQCARRGSAAGCQRRHGLGHRRIRWSNAVPRFQRPMKRTPVLITRRNPGGRGGGVAQPLDEEKSPADKRARQRGRLNGQAHPRGVMPRRMRARMISPCRMTYGTPRSPAAARGLAAARTQWRGMSVGSPSPHPIRLVPRC